MQKIDAYRARLRTLKNWDEFLLTESGLPGPRANLELVQAVADEGDVRLFTRYAAITPDEASTNSRDVFLAVCGVVGLGRLLAEGDANQLSTLRRLASDPRWRVREGVAMALQRWGDADVGAMLKAMADWRTGNWLEQRAVVAAICEPRLLREAKHAQRVLKLLDQITVSLSRATDRKSDDFRVLRQALAYGWSVAVVALPIEGKRALEKWFAHQDPDVRWTMRENLKKNRLMKMDAGWVRTWTAKLARQVTD
jgi:hypothetical protein